MALESPLLETDTAEVEAAEKGISEGVSEMKQVIEDLGRCEILCQLAEEAAELSQAALKLRRALDGKNHTPKTIEECEEALNEEIADVLLCTEYAGFRDMAHLLDQSGIMATKENSWVQRLEAAKNGV